MPPHSQVTSTPHPHLIGVRRLALLGRLLPLAALVFFGMLLLRRIDGINMAHLWTAVAATTPSQWALSAVATCASFVAVGQYDAGVHRMLGTDVAPIDARRAGIRAIAVGQMLGFGSLTGALVRWRCLPRIELWRATQISVLVSLSFLAAWAVIAAAMVAVTGLPLPGTMMQTISGAAALMAIAVTATFFMLRKTGARTGFGDLGAMLFWCLIDTSCAALALFVLFPAGIAPPAALFFTAYLLALGAGLLSNAPGGIGAFDLTLLSCLPMVDDATLLATVVAFRIIYYGLPAVLAFATLLRPVRGPAPCAMAPLRGMDLVRGLNTAPHPEWALSRQGATIWGHRGNGWMIQNITGHACAIGPAWGIASHRDVAQIARHVGRRPVLYKCDARVACQAQHDGWKALRTGAEALITPAIWALEGPQHRQLRRKLRHAEKSGISITQTPVLPITALRQIAQDWAAQHGGENGISMGRFDPHELARQQVFLAQRDGQTIAFVTFRASTEVWSLDLMRHSGDLPDGTMHSLIIAAIHGARRSGISSLSLAAAPLGLPVGLPGRLTRRAQGLTRFKQSFAPRWVPLYLCAPSWPAVLRAALTLTYAIHHPPPLHRVQSLGYRYQDNRAENTIENHRHACHGHDAILPGWGSPPP